MGRSCLHLDIVFEERRTRFGAGERGVEETGYMKSIQTNKIVWSGGLIHRVVHCDREWCAACCLEDSLSSAGTGD